jgi:hypothetical protein
MQGDGPLWFSPEELAREHLSAGELREVLGRLSVREFVSEETGTSAVAIGWILAEIRHRTECADNDSGEFGKETSARRTIPGFPPEYTRCCSVLAYKVDQSMNRDQIKALLAELKPTPYGWEALLPEDYLFMGYRIKLRVDISRRKKKKVRRPTQVQLDLVGHRLKRLTNSLVWGENAFLQALSYHDQWAPDSLDPMFHVYKKPGRYITFAIEWTYGEKRGLTLL